MDSDNIKKKEENNMKKKLCYLIIVSMLIISCVGCKSKTNESNKKDTKVVQTDAQEDVSNNNTDSEDASEPRKDTNASSKSDTHSTGKKTNESSTNTTSAQQSNTNSNVINSTSDKNNSSITNKEPAKTEHKHIYRDTIIESATCQSTGIKTYNCTSCSYWYNEIIPKAPCSWVEATCTVEKHCATCWSMVSPALGHNYKNFKCTRCGEKTAVMVHKVWMDDPGKRVGVGDKITLHMQVDFANKYEQISINFHCVENTLSASTAVYALSENKSCNGNTYTFELVIDDRMQPGTWTCFYYYAQDFYGEYVQVFYDDIANDMTFNVVQN